MACDVIRVLIIEDQPNLARDIQDLLQTEPGFVVIGMAHTYQEALLLIRATSPDLVLLDIVLDLGHTAFDLLAQFAPLQFKVVFLTGHARAEFAIKAIKYGALDYLLKPVQQQDLLPVLRRVLSAVPASDDQLRVVQQFYRGQPITHLPLQSHPFVKVVALEKICYCQAMDGTMFFLDNNQQVSVAKPISDYEALLPKDQFFRPHRSYLVNRSHIDRYQMGGDLILDNGTVIPVSDRRRGELLDFLNLPLTMRH